MKLEMVFFSSHLGSHDPDSNGHHRLSEPRPGVEGLCLPFISFNAKNIECAKAFIDELNCFCNVHDLDGLDEVRLVDIADKLSGL